MKTMGTFSLHFKLPSNATWRENRSRKAFIWKDFRAPFLQKIPGFLDHTDVFGVIHPTLISRFFF